MRTERTGAPKRRINTRTMSATARAKVLLGMTALLSGCANLPAFILNPQELYARPELPAKYTELSRLLNEIISSGAEYATPTSGSNIQSVQLIDLDGDGYEEAVACLRNSGSEKPLKICIFTAEGNSYRLFRQIEGSGTSIYSVAYVDLDGDGQQEIAVGWKAAADLQVLEIYSISGGAAQPLLRTDYIKYACADLDQDGRQEVVVLRAGEEGDSVAEYYAWQKDETLSMRARARISATMAELSQQGRVRAGTLDQDCPALFVTSVTDQATAVTDILALRGQEFVNLVLDPATGVSREISPFYSLYPTDIDNDGRTEIPRVVAPRTPAEELSACRLVEWMHCAPDGSFSTALYTCHALEDNWYLRLPDGWKDRVSVVRSVNNTSVSGEAVVTFSLRDTDQPFLRIYALTGSGRELKAVRGDRFVLNRQTAATYAGERIGGVWEQAMTEEDVRGAFSVISREWVSGDN